MRVGVRKAHRQFGQRRRARESIEVRGQRHPTASQVKARQVREVTTGLEGELGDPPREQVDR